MAVLVTKVLIPPPRPRAVPRQRLFERLDEGLHRKLTLVSASAGFGKTTLLGEWLRASGRPAAWLSLDSGDNDAPRFLSYLVAALQTVAPAVGDALLGALRSPQPPSLDTLLTLLLNDLTGLDHDVLLVLDDFHVIDAPPVIEAVTFLVEHMPPNLHVVLATREEPRLPLPRLRVRDQVVELRAADLRFTLSEASDFLSRTMDLSLAAEDVSQLESRTEGWIAGLQLAALSLKDHPDATAFIQSFGGRHAFVWDYVFEEVLDRLPERLKAFLLQTSILERLCAPLCEAVLGQADGEETLRHLERANLFIVPLDGERHWYRYHHLFAELLRKRLPHSLGEAPAGQDGVAQLHLRACDWYAANGQDLEALHHAVAAQDVSRAARLVEGNGMPLHFRGAVMPVLNWLASLPEAELDARPSLWVTYASALLFVGQMGGVEGKLQKAEAALDGLDQDDANRDLRGHIASIRATLAVGHGRPEVILAESQRALALLHPANLPVRTATAWTLGHAYQRLGDLGAARQAYDEALASSEAIGHGMITLAASIGLANLDEAENDLDPAAQRYRRVLHLAGASPMPVVSEAHLGLARIAAAGDDLEAAERHAEQALELAQRLEHTDRAQACRDMLVNLRRARAEREGPASPVLVEPLSEREREILRLIAQGLSNRDIGERLFLALDTVKGHNRRIFGKLNVQRRTEAIARARDLGLL